MMCRKIMVHFGLNYSCCVRILEAQHLRCVQGLDHPVNDAACMPGALFHSSPNVQAAIATTCFLAFCSTPPPVIHVTVQVVDPPPFADAAPLECSQGSGLSKLPCCSLLSWFHGSGLKSQRPSKQGGLKPAAGAAVLRDT